MGSGTEHIFFAICLDDAVIGYCAFNITKDGHEDLKLVEDKMNDLIAADAWMHNVLSFNTPIDVCKKRFREFNLIQDIFIRNEIQNVIIPHLYKRGDMDAVEAYEKKLILLEEIIAEKQ